MRMHEEWEQIGLSNDFLFGKVMRNPKLCKKLLERIFPDLQIERVEYPEIQKTIDEDVDARSVRLDVYVKDDKETVYNIEMQTTDTRELPKRARYYQSMIDLQLIDKGEAYKNLNRSFIIFICLSDIFGADRHIYTFRNMCGEEEGLYLGDETTKIFLNAGSSRDDVSKELRAFLDYIGGKKTNDSFVNELEEAVKEAKKNREWRREYMTLLMRDQENYEKGVEEGKTKGIKILYDTLRNMGISDEITMQQIMKSYHLTRAEAERYLKE